MSELKTKEPLVRIIKRDKSSFGYKVWVRAAAILLALVVDAIFIYSVTGLNPLSVYVVMFNGTFMTSIRFSWAMRDLVTLLCIGIALAPAFKMRFWNIGAEGQFVIGAVTAGGVALLADKSTGPWIVPAILLAGVLGGRGLLKGEALQDFINQHINRRPLEQLNRRFATVATDLNSGERVVFRTGDTGMAVRASAAVPGVFQPTQFRGHSYVDGGLTSPVPVLAAREMGADIVIACPHWGTEYSSKISSYQEKWALEMTEAGADVIIGTHPHVVEPVEWITAENGNESLCYYSLGNYVSTQKNALSMLEGMAWLTFHVAEDGVSIERKTTGVIPLVCQYTSGPVRFENVYLLEEYTEELAASHGIRNYAGVVLHLEDLQKWSDEILGDFVLTKDQALHNFKTDSINQ